MTIHYNDNDSGSFGPSLVKKDMEMAGSHYALSFQK